MKRLCLAIVGFGRLGQACAMAIHESEDLALAGLVRRPEKARSPLPDQFADVPVVSHPSELGEVNAVLICLPTERVRETATDLLQHHTPIVEAAAFNIGLRQAHWSAIDRLALRRGVAAVVGAGWDPGAHALFENLFTVLCPKGNTATRDRPGVSLHHTLAARAFPGVRDALCADFRGLDGRTQRYVYAEFSPDADVELATRSIQNDPLFLDQETVVLPVDSVATLEEEGHGVVIERWGRASGKDHQRFLLEGRFDRVAIAGQMMAAAARALPMLRPGAHPLDEIPPVAFRRASSNKGL